jgi:hypothetical protein
MLGAFSEIVVQDFPLSATGVLELVEEPMPELAVKAVLEIEFTVRWQAKQ